MRIHNFKRRRHAASCDWIPPSCIIEPTCRVSNLLSSTTRAALSLACRALVPGHSPTHLIRSSGRQNRDICSCCAGIARFHRQRRCALGDHMWGEATPDNVASSPMSVLALLEPPPKDHGGPNSLASCWLVTSSSTSTCKHGSISCTRVRRRGTNNKQCPGLSQSSTSWRGIHSGCFGDETMT